ncbi:MAG: hypothetical protein EXX96DRAFT_645279 [Benjaminiella poitrasii]|nr:MAG: hypothetical protein EXX96DRAFT_645279 [Benjaminiella poitrasii]
MFFEKLMSNLSSSFWSAADLQQSIVLPLLVDYLLHHLELVSNAMPVTSLVSDFWLCFHFPSLRPSPILDRDNPLYLLFKAIDTLPRDFAHVVINPKTALQLDIRSIVTTEPSLATRASMFNLAVCDAYLINHTTHVIRPRMNRELIRSPLLVKLFLKAVRDNIFPLAPFFLRTCIEPRFAHLSTPSYVPVTHRIIDAQTFLDSCGLASQGKDVSLKAFRIRCTSPPHNPTDLLTLQRWLSFWKYPILHPAHNVWYRVLLHKLPCRSTLHRFIPHLVDYPHCNVCSATTIETEIHFLFECPTKLMVWQTLWSSFFDIPFSVGLLTKALFHLDFPARLMTTTFPLQFVLHILYWLYGALILNSCFMNSPLTSKR